MIKDLIKGLTRSITKAITVYPRPSFDLPLTTSLTPINSTYGATFTRDSTATVTDFEGVVHTALVDEARFTGARRVENILEFSEDFSDDAWTKKDVTVSGTNKIIANGNTDPYIWDRVDFDRDVSGDDFIFNVDLWTDEDQPKEVQLFLVYRDSSSTNIGSRAADITLTTTQTRYEIKNLTIPSGTEQIDFRIDLKQSPDAGDYLYATDAQVERVTGSQTEASEYVSTNVSVKTVGGEKVVNGTFDTDSDWSKGAGWAISGGTATFDNQVSSENIIQADILEADRNYSFTYEVIDNNSYTGVLKLPTGVVSGELILEQSEGIHRIVFNTTGVVPTDLQIRCTAGTGTISIDNISIKEELYHGANVDGVKYFDTDRDGNPISNALGSEKVTNGGFDTSSDWTFTPPDWVIASGKANSLGIGDSAKIQQDVGAEVGKTYRLTFDLNYLDGALFISSTGFGDETVALPFSSGSYEYFITAVNTDDLVFSTSAAPASFTGSIDNVSVKEVLYPSAYPQPKGYRCDKGAENLVLQSEDFGTTWAKGSNVSIITNDYLSPEGTKTADNIVATTGAGSGSNRVYQNISIGSSVNGRTFTFSLYLRADSPVTIPLRIADISDSDATQETINITTEWQRFEIKRTFSTSVETSLKVTITDYNRTAAYDVYAWGAQVEESSFPTSYIKTTTATVTRAPDELSFDNTDNQVLPNSFSLIMSTTPVADGEDYETSDIKLLGSDDTNGVNDEIKTNQGASYNFNPLTGGGTIQLDKADIDIDTKNKYGFQLYQDGADADAKIFLNGTKEHEETNAQTLAHSDTSIFFGFHSASYYTGNIKDVKIYDQKLTDSTLKELTR